MKSKPLLKISNIGNQRKIERAIFEDDPLIRARLRVSDLDIEVAVSDISSGGVGIKLTEDLLPKFTSGQTIDWLAIYYGKKLLAETKNSKVVNVTGDRLGISFVHQGSRLDRKRGRLVINPSMEPVMFAPDPIEHHQLLHMRVLNISMKGLLASTSISNRHILPGALIQKATLVLPGLGLCESSLTVRNIKVEGKLIYIGCEFESPTKDLQNAVARFALIGGENDSQPPEIYARKLKELDFPLKSVGSVTKLVRVSSKKHYDEMLRVRFDSYKAASKVVDGWDYADMSDSYDEHSYNYIAIANGISIATFRLTVCRGKSERFPFEEMEPFDEQRIGFKREDIFEVSKLAILPEFQNTDIVLSLFRKVGIEGLKHKKALCMLSTKSLRSLYFRLGAKVISEEHPHPTVHGETLALLVLPVKNYMKGRRMSGISWELLPRFVVEHFNWLGIKVSASSTLYQAIRAKIERFILRLLKKFK